MLLGLNGCIRTEPVLEDSQEAHYYLTVVVTEVDDNCIYVDAEMGGYYFSKEEAAFDVKVGDVLIIDYSGRATVSDPGALCDIYSVEKSEETLKMQNKDAE